MIGARLTAAAAALCILPLTSTLAEDHPTGVPVLNSRPGAAYTIYLDFGGFTFGAGSWLPGVFDPYNGDNPVNPTLPTGTFDAAQQDVIRGTWASLASNYRSFDINITTVDPAVAAGQAATDALRQDYYDSQVGLAHTVFTPTDPTGVSGLSLLGVLGSVRPPGSGQHTNFAFTGFIDRGDGAGQPNYLYKVAAHENGHILGLNHQDDTIGGVYNGGYGLGDTFDSSPDPGYQAYSAGGVGFYGPTMAVPINFQRATFAVGFGTGPNPDPRSNQNDVAVILSNAVNPGLTLVDSGNGHTRATATPLPVLGGLVDFTQAEGVISPADPLNPQPLGIDNYTKDYFSFFSDGLNPITLTANNGTDFLTPGVADLGITLRSKLNIYDILGNLIGTATEDASTLFETYSGLLGAGLYYAEITSFGGHVQITDPAFDPKHYYDMGGYFLTGSGMVPEPGTGLLMLSGVVSSLALRRRRSAGA